MTVKPLNLEGAVIGFRNFEGREGAYNKAGMRSFAVFLNRETALDLQAQGWNVKFPKEHENTDPDMGEKNPYLQVTVAFENFPPNVFLISGNNPPTRLEEQEVAMLDWAELETVDLVIRPYTWSVNGKTGVKAYLKAGYFTIVTDQFQHKYGL